MRNWEHVLGRQEGERRVMLIMLIIILKGAFDITTMKLNSSSNYSFLLEVEDAVAMEEVQSPWTSQRFCATTPELIAAGSGAIAGLVLVAVVLVIVTWRCTKCLGRSGGNDDSTTELQADHGKNGNGIGK